MAEARPSRTSRTTTQKPPVAQSTRTTGGAPISKVDDSQIHVTYGIQVTKKLAEFEFIKINSEVSVPLNISDDDLARIDAKLVVIREKITDRLAQDLQEIDI